MRDFFRRQCGLISWLLLVTYFCTAQTDSTTLSYQDYLVNIINYHPVAQQANLKLDMAEFEWLAAKGNFDPIITSDWNQKKFDDKRYYRIFQNRLQIPTKLGIDVVAGYENTEGTFLNPENKTDQYGLWNIGIEANLLQGLLVNERQTALEQTKVMQSIAQNQQQIILNELLFVASTVYLDWQQFFYIQSVLKENENLANQYFENTKASFLGGEKTVMDTLEAYILFQDAKAMTAYNESALIEARQKVENYLWFNSLPLELQATAQPEDYQKKIFQISDIRNMQAITDSNPIIVEKLNKLSYYELDLKLKKEKLKPKLKAKLNPLIATNQNNIVPSYNANDYKLGFDFSFPLFLRSERANVQKGKIKLQEIELDIQNKQNEILNKIENNIQQQAIIRNQLNLIQQNVNGYRALLEGENEKFRFGESSVFLLNKRQEKYINGRIKLIELNIKLQLLLLKYLYYTNDLVK